MLRALWEMGCWGVPKAERQLGGGQGKMGHAGLRQTHSPALLCRNYGGKVTHSSEPQLHHLRSGHDDASLAGLCKD